MSVVPSPEKEFNVLVLNVEYLLRAVLRGVVEHVGVGDLCTFRVVSLVRANILVTAVFPLTETLVRSWWRFGLPVLVVVSQKDCRGVPLTAAMDLSVAVLMVTHTEPSVAPRVCWTGSQTGTFLASPSGKKNCFTEKGSSY